MGNTLCCSSANSNDMVGVGIPPKAAQSQESEYFAQGGIMFENLAPSEAGDTDKQMMS